METINVYDALRVMRRLSSENVPFSFEFVSCDRTKGKSQGLVMVEKALLRKGYRKNQSDFSNTLIAYDNLETGEQRQFRFPLLLRFNGIKISFER